MHENIDGDVSEQEGLPSVGSPVHTMLIHLSPPLQALSGMTTLRRLDISRCADVTDKGISALARGRAPIEMLSMKSMDSVTGSSHADMANMNHLR